MNTPIDGGPAFPHDAIEDPDAEGCFYGGYPGMTLRDYFAAKAMQGLISGTEWNFEPAGAMPVLLVTDLTLCSYQIADAMIKARSAA